jgi:hypothetical protein
MTNRMLTRGVLLLAFALIAGMFGDYGRAHAVLSLYDDFNDPSHLVRADLWNKNINFTTSGVGSGVTEVLSIVDALLFPTPNPKLLVARRFVLQPGGTAGNDFYRYSARNTAGAVGAQADVAMLVCALDSSGLVQAGLSFAVFNDGTSTGPTDSTGDIFARLRIGCTATNQAEVTWNVFRCTDSGCNNASSLGSGSIGAVVIGQEVSLNISKSGSSFVFTALGQTQIFPVPGSPTAPARGPFLLLFSRIDPSVPANGGEFVVGASFDNVMIDK